MGAHQGSSPQRLCIITTFALYGLGRQLPVWSRSTVQLLEGRAMGNGLAANWTTTKTADHTSRLISTSGGLGVWSATAFHRFVEQMRPCGTKLPTHSMVTKRLYEGPPRVVDPSKIRSDGASFEELVDRLTRALPIAVIVELNDSSRRNPVVKIFQASLHTLIPVPIDVQQRNFLDLSYGQCVLK